MKWIFLFAFLSLPLFSYSQDIYVLAAEFEKHLQNQDFDQAIIIGQKTVKLLEEIAAPESDYINVLNNLAYAYEEQGDYQSALALIKEICAVEERLNGLESPDYITLLENLASNYVNIGKYKTADSVYQQVWTYRNQRKVAAPDDYIRCLINRSDIYLYSLEFDKAEKCLIEAKAVHQEYYSSKKENTSILNNLAEVYRYTQRYSEAEKIYLKLKRIVKTEEGESLFYSTVLNNLALTYKLTNRLPEAISLNIKSLAIKARIIGKDNPKYGFSVYNLAVAYLQNGEYDKAEPLLLLNYQTRKKYQNIENTGFHHVLSKLVELYTSDQRYDKAIIYFKELISIQKSIYGITTAYCEFHGQLAEFFALAHKLDEAEMTYKIALSCLENQPNYSRVVFADIANEFGEFYRINAMYDEAQVLHEKALKIRLIELGDQHIDYAISLNNLALVLQEIDSKADVESLYKEAIQIFRSQSLTIESGPDVSGILSNLAAYYEIIGRYSEAEDLLQEAISLLRDNDESPSANEALYMHNLAAVYASLDKQELAILHQEGANQIWQNLSGVTSPNYSMGLNNLAKHYQSFGHYEKAAEMFEEALKLIKSQQGENSMSYGIVLDNLGVLKLDMGLYDIAEKLQLQANVVLKKYLKKDHPIYIENIHSLAYLYIDLGRYLDAEKLIRESIELQKKVLGERHISYATSLNDLAVIFQLLGRYTESESLFLESIKKIRTHFGDKHLSYANVMNNLSALYESLGRYDDALRIMITVNEIRSEKLEPDHHLMAQTANQMGVCYIGLGQFDNAINSIQRAISIQKKNLPKHILEYAQSLDNLAYSFRMVHREEESIAIYTEANDIFKKNSSSLHPDYAINVNGLATAHYFANQFDLALAYYEEAFSISKNLIRYSFSRTSESELQAFFELNKFELEDFYSFLKDSNLASTAMAYNNQIFSKGLLLNSQQQLRNDLINHEDKQVQLLFRNYKKQINQLSIWFNLTPKELLNLNVDLETEKQKANTLERDLYQYANYSAFAEDLTWQDVQKQLQPDEAAIELIRFNYSKNDSLVFYAALIVTNKLIHPKIVFLENGNDLENRWYKEYLKSRYSSSNELYENFWAPIQKELSNINKVFLSADGIYNQINLDILPTQEHGQFLSDHLEIVLVNSTRVLVDSKLKLKTIPYNNPVLVGGITYGDTATWNQDNWYFLPGSDNEIDNISDLLKIENINTEIIRGREATEEKIKVLRNPFFLHLATHGYFHASDYDKIQNIQSRKYQGKLNNGNDWALNPLLRSGLVLSNANILQAEFKGNDGLLTAYEIGNNLDLRGTELVILSACNTGKGRNQNGEGVYGLWRAFQLAGAQSLIMSLWPVQDQVAEEFFSSFYKNWLVDGMDKREAFYEARKLIRTDWEDTGHWGSFIFVSN